MAENRKGNIGKYTKHKGYESLNRNMLQDTDNLSLESIGLLCYLTSMTENWVIYKTDLYKRFLPLTGRRKVERAWNELVEHRYIVQLRKRVGKKYEYMYYHSQEKFTDEEIKTIEEEEGCGVWNGKMTDKIKENEEKPDSDNDSSNVQSEQSSDDPSTVQNEQYNVNCSDRTDNRFTNNEVYYQLQDLDTNDTGQESYPHVDKSADDKESMRQKYFDDARVNNSEKIPPNLAQALSVLTETREEADRYYKVIAKAKKSVENELDVMIQFENMPEIETEVIRAFTRTMRMLSIGVRLDNVEGYIYNSIQRALMDILKPSRAIQDHPTLYDWTKDENED